MKVERVFGLVFVVLGILIMLVPRVFFPVCGLENDPFFIGKFSQFHGCHATLHAVTVLGLLAVFTGSLALLKPNKATFLTAIITSFAVSALTILFPLKITGMCKMPTMSCRLGTLPGLVTAGIIMAIAGIFSVIAYRKKSEDE